jgi:transcriptional regulator with XRE-family HTH domain
MNEALAKQLGNAARAARHRAQLTQAEVASLIGISPVVYSRMERGMVLPSVPTLCRLCDALHVSSDTLLGRSGKALEATAPAQAGLSPEETAATHLRRLLALVPRMNDSQLQALTTVAAALLR